MGLIWSVMGWFDVQVPSKLCSGTLLDVQVVVYSFPTWTDRLGGAMAGYRLTEAQLRALTVAVWHERYGAPD